MLVKWKYTQQINIFFSLLFYAFRLGMSLAKQKESLIRDRDKLTVELDDLNKRLQQQRTQNENLEKKRVEYEEKCRELYKSLDVRSFK